MSGRAQLIQRSRQVKRRRKLLQLAGLAFLVLIAVCLTVYTLYRPRWRVSSVVVVGAKSINAADVIGLIDKQTDGSYFLLAPKNSRLFYPNKNLTEKIAEAFPRIADLRFVVSGSALTVEIIERESELLWCLNRTSLVKDCYFVDATGLAFASAPNFTDHVLFEIYQVDRAVEQASSSPLGTTVLPASTLITLNDQKAAIHKVLADQKMFDRSIITAVELLPGQNYSFAIRSPALLGGEWRLLTNGKMSGADLTKLLTALFGSTSFTENVIRTKQSLEYIDARLATKVFFKVLDHNNNGTP